MTDQAENDRAVLGGNNPPLAKLVSDQDNFAQAVTDFLADEFKALPVEVSGLLAEAAALPKVIEDDTVKGQVTALIKRLRDCGKKLDALHEKEATPYLRGKQAVDTFFFGMIDRVARRNKNNNAGAADILNARLTDYDTRKLEEERIARQRAAAEAARIEREAQEAAAALAAQAEADRLAAERARAPAKIEEKAQVAAVSEQKSDAAKVDVAVATAKADDTHIATKAKASDIMRSRDVSTGTLSTMREEPFAEIEDEGALDKEKLWPFIPLAAKQQALNAFARNTGHTQQIAGAKIGRRPKSVVR